MCSLIPTSVICLGVIIIFLSIYVYLFNPFYDDEESICKRPFVQIGKNCYFFSAMNMPNDYYKIKYKNRYFSVPTKLDWQHTGFSCETLELNAHPISLDTAKEMNDIAYFMMTQKYPMLYKFWSSGHRLILDDVVITDNFYWYNKDKPMNFTNWLIGQPSSFEFPEGCCLNLQYTFGDIFMATTNCLTELPFVCELDN